MRIPTSRRPPWVSFSRQIPLLYSQILLAMVIPGILVFHYAWGDNRSHGLFIAVGLSPIMKNRTCGNSWAVRIDARENWYLNSIKTPQRELAGTLNQQLGDKTNCAVYLDVDPSLPYEVAIEAIATIQQTRAKVVVLLTPKTTKLSALLGIVRRSEH
jgi:hypothetical protein